MLTYTTGTINEPDAGSVGLTMIEQIRDDLVAHAAWDLVEEFTPGGGAVRWYVFKCLATESGLSGDFFVVIGRTLATGELRGTICEGYDSTTHTMSKIAPIGTTSNVAYDADGCSPSTYVLGTAAFNSNTNTPSYTAWTPNSISTKWWLCIDDDGFTVGFNGSQNGFFHIGAYTPLSVLPITLPIQSMGYNSNQTGITRNPAVASQSKHGFALTAEGGHGPSASSSISQAPTLGFRGDARYNDALQSNMRAVAEQGINVYQYDATKAAEYGYALGKQKRMRVLGGSAPAGFAFGDAYAIEGTLWVPFSTTDLRVWDTGVAA